MGLIETLTGLTQDPTMLTSSRQSRLFQKAPFCVKEPFTADEKCLSCWMVTVFHTLECFYFLPNGAFSFSSRRFTSENAQKCLWEDARMNSECADDTEVEDSEDSAWMQHNKIKTLQFSGYLKGKNRCHWAFHTFPLKQSAGVASEWF